MAGHSFGAGIAFADGDRCPRQSAEAGFAGTAALLSLVPSRGQFTEWVASVREIYDSGDKTAAIDMVLAGAYGQDYRRSEVALPAGLLSVLS